MKNENSKMEPKWINFSLCRNCLQFLVRDSTKYEEKWNKIHKMEKSNGFLKHFHLWLWQSVSKIDKNCIKILKTSVIHLLSPLAIHYNLDKSFRLGSQKMSGNLPIESWKIPKQIWNVYGKLSFFQVSIQKCERFSLKIDDVIIIMRFVGVRKLFCNCHKCNVWIVLTYVYVKFKIVVPALYYIHELKCKIENKQPNAIRCQEIWFVW